METIKTKFGELRYREMIWINGQAIKSPLFKRKTDCSKWKHEKLAEKNKFQIFGENKLTEIILFEDISRKWLNARIATGLSRATIKKYSDFCRFHFNPIFGQRDLKTIQKNEIENFQIQLRKNHNAKGTNVIMTGLKAIFKEAVKEGYLTKSPCEFVRKISVDQVRYKYWTKSEVDQFLKVNFRSEHYDLILIALNTGMRKGELAGLCWDRIDFSMNTITVTRTKDRFELKERTKTNHVRIIPMNEICRATMLKIFKNNSSKSQFVFLDSSGKPFRSHHIGRDMLKMQKVASITNIIRFHDLRHTFASQYVMSGGNIYDLQKFLGHSSILMTQVYAHQSQDYLQSAMKGFSLGSNTTSDENSEKFNQNLTIFENRSLKAL